MHRAHHALEGDELGMRRAKRLHARRPCPGEIGGGSAGLIELLQHDERVLLVDFLCEGVGPGLARVLREELSHGLDGEALIGIGAQALEGRRQDDVGREGVDHAARLAMHGLESTQGGGAGGPRLAHAAHGAGQVRVGRAEGPQRGVELLREDEGDVGPDAGIGGDLLAAGEQTVEPAEVDAGHGGGPL